MTEESKKPRWTDDPRITRREFEAGIAAVGAAAILGNAHPALGEQPEPLPHVPLGRLVLGGGKTVGLFDELEKTLPENKTWPEYLKDRKIVCVTCGAAYTYESSDKQEKNIRESIARNKRFYEEKGVSEENIIFINSRADAEKEEYAAVIRNPGNRILFDGGEDDQDSLVKGLADTPVGRAIQERYFCDPDFFAYMTSASSMSLAKHMLSINDDNRLPEVHIGMGWFPGAIIDTHIHDNTPSRLMRLLDAVKQHPECIGFGIDSHAALDIAGGEAKVVGSGNAYVVESIHQTEQEAHVYKPGTNIRDDYAHALTTVTPLSQEMLARYDAEKTPVVSPELKPSAAVKVSPVSVKPKSPPPMR